MTTPLPPPRRGDLARGAAAGLLVLALLAGLPIGLLAVDAGPQRLLPTRWPRLAEIDQAWLERSWHALRFALADGSLIQWLLLAVIWGAWLLLLALLVAELAQQLRHGARSLPAGTGPRRWIAGMVAAILIGLLPQSALALPATGSTPVATALHNPTGQTAHSPRTSTVDSVLVRRRTVEAAVCPECPRVTVRPGETMTGLAQAHLGDPGRYVEIHRLNADRIPRADLLHPGDVLLLPPNTTPAPTPPPAGAVAVTVAAGETASSIAQREYGHHGEWRRLWQDNRRRAQPDGGTWTDPDHLRPGWRLWITPPPTQPANPPPPATRPSPTTSPPQPATTATPTAPHSATPTPGQPDLSAPAEAVVHLPSGAIIGIGLAVSIALAAATLRLHRRRRRRLTPTLDPPTPTPALPPTVAHLERAALQRGPLPPQHRGWPPPAAVITAHTTTGQHLTLDLAATAGLGLIGAGAADAARAASAAILAADALYPAELIVADTATARVLCLPETTTQPPDEQARATVAGVRCFDDTATALQVLETEVARRTRLLAEAELDDHLTDQASADRDCRQAVPGEAMPTVLVLATPQAATTPRLRAALEVGRGLGVIGVLLGQWLPELEVDAAGHITATRGEHTTAVVGARLETLTAAEATDVLGTIIAARSGSDTEAAATPNVAVSPPTEATAPATTGARMRPAPVRLQVFGRPKITVVGTEITTGLRSLGRELLTYLATHPDGAAVEVLQDQLLPETAADTGRAQIHTAVSNIRTAFRKATGIASAQFLHSRTGRYHLDPTLIAVDARDLTAAIAHARTAASDRDQLAALHPAVELCRSGPPLNEVGYLWAEEIRESLRQQALNALMRIADLQRPLDADAAADALTVAITIDPYVEALYQHLIRLYRDTGRPEEAERIFRRLKDRLADIDAEPELETAKLVNLA